MYHNEIPERCKLDFTGIADDALRIAGELFPKQTLKKYIRKKVEIDTDGWVRSRRFEKRKVAERFKEMPFLKAKRHRAHSVVSGVRVKGKQAKKKNDPALRDYKRSTSSLESLIGH
ncbi:hypothetical protein TNCV_762271 [Trichonephila clavipes]|nr:hypothetical protein TNCV_762271 [Trichonephila clavipes]